MPDCCSSNKRGGDKGRDWRAHNSNAPIKIYSTVYKRNIGQASMDNGNGEKCDRDNSKSKSDKRECDKSERKNREKDCNKRDRKSKRCSSPDFHQILRTVKGRMDNTFRGLEKGIRKVERNINEELADVLAQVMAFEEGMKPQLMEPYKKCKEFECLIAPALSCVPKRSASENEKCRRKCTDDKKGEEASREPPEMTPKERYLDLMSSMADKDGRAEAARTGSRESCNPCNKKRRDRCDPADRQREMKMEKRRERYKPCPRNEYDDDDCSLDTSAEDEVCKTMQELEDISISVNKSLKRINRAFNNNEEEEEEWQPCPPVTCESRPEMLTRVNDSLAQIGSGAKRLKRLLVEERTKAS